MWDPVFCSHETACWMRIDGKQTGVCPKITHLTACQSYFYIRSKLLLLGNKTFVSLFQHTGQRWPKALFAFACIDLFAAERALKYDD